MVLPINQYNAIKAALRAELGVSANKPGFSDADLISFFEQISQDVVARSVVNPLSIDKDNLLCWVTADERYDQGVMKATGTTPPVISYQGALQGTNALTLKCSSVAGGTGLGQAQLSVYVDDGNTPVMTNVLTSAALYGFGSASGVKIVCPAGPYAVDNVWRSVSGVLIDQSNQGADYGATNPAFAPTSESVGWNGKASMLWDGSSSLMYVDGQTLAAAVCGGLNTAFHVYMSLQLNATTAGQTIFNYGRNDGGSGGFSFDVAAGPVYSITKTDSTGASATVTGGVPDTSQHLIEIHHTGTVVSLIIDGVAVSLSSAGAQRVGTLSSLNTGAIGLKKTVAASQFCSMRAREFAAFGAGHNTLAQAAMRVYMTANN